MAERSVEQLTLREMFINAERLTRELVEHLEQGFLPKVHQLEKLFVQDEERSPDDVLDVTVRNHVATVLESDDFTQTLCQQIDEYLSAIEKAVQRHVPSS